MAKHSVVMCLGTPELYKNVFGVNEYEHVM